MDDLTFSEKEFSKLTLEEIKALGDINKIRIETVPLIFYLIKRNNIEFIRNLKDDLNLNIKNFYGVTPLSRACNEDNLEIVKLFLKEMKVEETINVKDIHEDSPLLNACENNNFEMVKMLVESGAEITTKNRYKHSPLYEACKHGNFEMFKLLLENMTSDIFIQEMKIKNIDGISPLHQVCYTKNYKMIEVCSEYKIKFEVDEGGYYECLKYFPQNEKEELQNFIFEVQSRNIKKGLRNIKK